METVPDRSDIPPDYRWDLESIFPSDEEWEDAFSTLRPRIDDLAAYENDLTTRDDGSRGFSDGATLLKVLRLRDDIARNLDMVYAYAQMRSHEDTRDQTYQAMATRARSLTSRFASAASFIGPAIQTHSESELEAMIDATNALEPYDHYLEDIIRAKPHTRSPEIEALLADLGEILGATGEVYNLLMNADITFPTVEQPDGTRVELTHSNYTKLLKEPDREFRHTVHDAFYETLGEVRNTIGAALKNTVKRHVKLARARNYASAREAALDAPNIPETVYDTLVDTVRDNLAPLHRHTRLKRHHLGVDDLEMWDLYMPLTETEGPPVPYEDATAYVIDALAPLGNDYQSQVRTGLKARWVDVYENRGKQSGAYSGGTYDTHPFILMNWQDDITSMFTLAHELGHSMHSELASQHQPYIYADYDIFVAEVASTVNEVLLTHHLLETVTDDDFRRHVVNEHLERFRSTLYRQTLFAEFEHQIHALDENDEPLTPDRLDDLYGELKRTYYDAANVSETAEQEWMRIPHFHYNFYVYQYATGMSAAVDIATRIRTDREEPARDYLKALAMGGSTYPLDILETAGVDLTAPEPIEAAITEYETHIDVITELLDSP